MMPRSRQMVGRDAELGLLLDAASQAGRGSPQLVLVTGEAGIGKSRLVAETLDKLDGAVVGVSHAVDMATGEIPFGVFADLLRDLLRRDPAILTTHERGRLMSLLPATSSAGPTSVTVDRVSLLSAGLELLERLSQNRLVCWVVEDLHWADAATRDLLSLVARTVQQGRLLMVATVRTGASVGDVARDTEIERAIAPYIASLARLPTARTVPLHRLSQSQVDRLLIELLDRALPPGTASRIAELSDGVPFLVEQLVSLDGHAQLSPLASVLRSRVDGLGAETRRLVDAAAIGAGHLRRSLLQQVLGWSVDVMDDALDSAAESGALAEDVAPDEVRFRHALLRDAVIRTMPPSARRNWHRLWAQVLESNPGVLAADPALVAIAEHWFLGGEAERALPATLAAAQAAARTGAAVDELRLWQRAIDLWPPDKPPVSGWTWRDALARAVVFEPDTSGFVSRQISNTEDPALADTLTKLLRASSLPKVAITELGSNERQTTEALLRSGPKDVWLAMGLLMLASGCPPDDPAGERFLNEAEELFTQADFAPGAVRASAVRFWRLTVTGGGLDREADGLQQILARSSTPAGQDLWTLDGNLLWALTCTGRHAEVEAAYQRARRRVPDPRAAGRKWEHIVENVCASWTETGQWDRALALIRESRPYWGEARTVSDLRQARLELRRTGQLPDASMWTAMIAAPVGQGGPQAAECAHLVAEWAGVTGNREQLRRAGAVVWSAKSKPNYEDMLWAAARDLTRWEADWATSDTALNDRGASLDHLERIRDVAASIPRAGPLGDVWPLELKAQWARVNGDDARALFEQALTGWQTLGHAYDTARCNLYLAENAAASGDRESARAYAQQALTMARELNAEPLARQTEILLDRIGSRHTGTGGLTARELEVLQLLAHGHTNGQIAAQLFMSPKTASVHVSHILDKLGAANRTEAAMVARFRGLT